MKDSPEGSDPTNPDDEILEKESLRPKPKMMEEAVSLPTHSEGSRTYAYSIDYARGRNGR